MAHVITLVDTDIETLRGHGTIATITGTNEDGLRVTFGAEPRMLDYALEALVTEQAEISVEVEDWQVLGVSPVEAP